MAKVFGLFFVLYLLLTTATPAHALTLPTDSCIFQPNGTTCTICPPVTTPQMGMPCYSGTCQNQTCVQSKPSSPPPIICGGIQGIPCPTGYHCEYSGNRYPDASGLCFPVVTKSPLQLPDLVVTKITKFTGNPLQDNKFYSVTVCNQGQKEVGKPFYSRLSNANNLSKFFDYYSGTWPVEPDFCFTFGPACTDLGVASCDEKISLVATADSHYLVTESNEFNNTLKVSFTGLTPTPAPTYRPHPTPTPVKCQPVENPCLPTSCDFDPVKCMATLTPYPTTRITSPTPHPTARITSPFPTTRISSPTPSPDTCRNQPDGTPCLSYAHCPVCRPGQYCTALACEPRQGSCLNQRCLVSQPSWPTLVPTISFPLISPLPSRIPSTPIIQQLLNLLRSLFGS